MASADHGSEPTETEDTEQNREPFTDPEYDDHPYVVGKTHHRTLPFARFRTKPARPVGDRMDTGAGYERWMSWEWRPETVKRSKENCYVPHHRLFAVIDCYPMDMPLSDILDHMKGRDVHHNAPEEDRSWGVPWDTRPGAVEVIGHGRHSSLTQAEMRAIAEDAKNTDSHQARFESNADYSDGCESCGETDTTLATCAAYDGVRCLDCAMEESNDETINVEGD